MKILSAVSGEGKGGIMKFLVLGIVVSMILAFNIPARFGLGGTLISAAALAGIGLFTRKQLGVFAVGAIVAAGLIVGQSFITPRVSGLFSPTNADAPAALTSTQLGDPVVRRFR